jgi:hypothetical protein
MFDSTAWVARAEERKESRPHESEGSHSAQATTLLPLSKGKMEMAEVSL